MVKAITTTVIVLAGLINLAPVIGVVSAARLEALYGVALEDANLVVLLRHRAVLFGIVGGLLVASAFRPHLRPFAILAGLTSMLSFVVITWIVGGTNSQLARILLVDLVASVALLGAVLLERFGGPSSDLELRHSRDSRGSA